MQKKNHIHMSSTWANPPDQEEKHLEDLGEISRKGPYWDLGPPSSSSLGISISFKRILIKLCSWDLLYNWQSAALERGTFLIA